MRVVIQRVSEASCKVENEITGSIGPGFVVLLGITENDSDEDLAWLSHKIAQLRVFSDENGLMNKSILDIDGNILLISQFTLFAQTKKGNRPSFIRAAKPAIAIPLYEKFKWALEGHLSKKIATGVFGADMKISLVNDGPVTIIMDTEDKDKH